MHHALGVNFAQGYLLGRPMPLGASKVSLNQIMRTWVQRCAASRGTDDFGRGSPQAMSADHSRPLSVNRGRLPDNSGSAGSSG
jgi:hypothetical protein